MTRRINNVHEVSWPRFQRLADHGLVVTFGDAIDLALCQRIARLRDLLAAEAAVGADDPLAAEPRFWVDDLVPAYTTLTVIGQMPPQMRGELEDRIRDLWSGLADDPRVDDTGTNREIVVPVEYGGAAGPDLGVVAATTGLSTDEVIRRHSAAQYTVATLGFAPGFAYLAGLPGDLAIPRRAVPRTAVPAGSVAIGGGQAGVYSVETPGGWHILGRTPLRLFDPANAEPTLLRQGDRVRFQPVTHAVFPEREPEPPVVPSWGDVLEVIQPGLQTTVQDGGRHGLGRFGLAPNGAADRFSHLMGSVLLHDHHADAALEITGGGFHARFLRPVRFIVTGRGRGVLWNGRPLPDGGARVAMPGDEIQVDVTGRKGEFRAYLCIAGGFGVPMVLGSRSTDLAARIGGYRGRPLRAGDRLPGGKLLMAFIDPRRPRLYANREHPFEVMRGPQADRFDPAMFERFLTATFAVSPQSNRVGLRLDGPRLVPSQADIISEGMVTGAIQVTGSGQPIVMLPGRATVGGYPKIAVVVDADLDRLGQLAPGDRVRFALAGEPAGGST